MKPKGVVKAILLCGMVLVFPAAEAFAGATIGLSGVPDDLSFPLPAGTNVILTATVKGVSPESVWLAESAGARARYMLSPVGEGKYQVNLADAAVQAVLSSGEGAGQFRVFARLGGGKVVSTIPVRFDAAEPVRVPPTVYVHADGAKERITWEPFFLDDCPGLSAEFRGQSILLRSRMRSYWRERAREPVKRWFLPAEADRIECEFSEKVAEPSAEARTGHKTWPVRATSSPAVLALKVTDELREAWRKSGSLVLVCRHGDREVRRVILKAPPAKLDLPARGAQVTVVQRRSKQIPGSDGYLRLHIDDITGGQVLVSLRTRDERRLMSQQSMSQGQERAFEVADARYTLKLKKLVNLLVGDDYAVFQVKPVGPIDKEQEKRHIKALIRAVENASVTFVRDERSMGPAEMAGHLRKKLSFVEPRIDTLDQFIDRVASVSWATGNDYMVKRPDGTKLKAREWLKEKSATLFESPSTDQ